MQTISFSDARDNFTSLIEQSQREPIIIQKQGRSASVLISFEEYQRLTNEPVAAFQALCDNIGSKAQTKGLGEEELARLLNEAVSCV